MLFSVAHDGEERDVMVNSVAPVRFGNETWFGARRGRAVRRLSAGLCSAITDALVIPLTAMLTGLIFSRRGL
ncbi:cytochrome d ubiquinol oxidase subunit II [Klebsiella pneumoniae]|nr:cytochrome d ubiquinol oxidase subunit II [Klebsiella pneumoniae]